MVSVRVNNVGDYPATFDEYSLKVAGRATATIYNNWDYSCGITHPEQDQDSFGLPREIQVPAETAATIEVCWEVDEADAPTLSMDWYGIWFSLSGTVVQVQTEAPGAGWAVSSKATSTNHSQACATVVLGSG